MWETERLWYPKVSEFHNQTINQLKKDNLNQDNMHLYKIRPKKMETETGLVSKYGCSITWKRILMNIREEEVVSSSVKRI